jgi:hypothetical protein
LDIGKTASHRVAGSVSAGDLIATPLELLAGDLTAQQAGESEDSVLGAIQGAVNGAVIGGADDVDADLVALRSHREPKVLPQVGSRTESATAGT